MPEEALYDREAAAVLLARGLTTDAVGAEVGVNGRTVRRWREDPEFERRVQDARKAILAESVGALTAAVRDAVSVLHEALEDRSAVIRVRAASELLKALPSIASHAELDARVAALETHFEQEAHRVIRAV